MAEAANTRRILRFKSIAEALAEADQLAQADADGCLTRLGNWSLGQALGHLATWADFANDGYPPTLIPPAPIRLLARLFKNHVLKKGMKPGVKIPKVPGGTVGTDDMPTAQGLRKFHTAFQRLATTAPNRPNPLFGKLTHQQWIDLNLRHAELHLSFFGTV